MPRPLVTFLSALPLAALLGCTEPDLVPVPEEEVEGPGPSGGNHHHGDGTGTDSGSDNGATADAGESDGGARETEDGGAVGEADAGGGEDGGTCASTGAVQFSVLLESSGWPADGMPTCTSSNPCHEILVRRFTSQADFDAFLRVELQRSAPTGVDFSKDEVAVAYSCYCKTGGFSLRTLEIRSDGCTLDISTRLNEPGPTCGVTAALTRPYSAVSFAKSSATSVAASLTTQTFSCGRP